MQTSNGGPSRKVELAFMRLLLAILKTAAITVLLLATAQADDRDRRHECRRETEHNYIIERQQAYMIQGPPTSRLIIGRREIDGYSQRDGSKIWFEKNNVVGITR